MKDNFRYVVACLLAANLLATLARPLTAQSTPQDLVVRSLRVVSPDGTTIASIAFADEGGSLLLRDRRGNPRVGIGIQNSESRDRIIDGGYLSLINRDGKVSVALDAGPSGHVTLRSLPLSNDWSTLGGASGLLVVDRDEPYSFPSLLDRVERKERKERK